MRGSSVTLKRSLRMRVLAASALAFLGLTAMVCLVLPRAYEHVARSAFADRTEAVTRGIAHLLRAPEGGGEPFTLAAISGWLVADPVFEGAAVLEADGSVRERWPEHSTSWGEQVPEVPTVLRGSSSYLAYHPVVTPDGSVRVASVRMSTSRLERELENVRWLFASLFLFNCGVFFALTNYLTRTILQPLQAIGRAAMSLADGEPFVDVPRTGDHEIDDLGAFIAKLGESRRHSRVMTSPMDLLAARARGHARRETPDGPPR